MSYARTIQNKQQAVFLLVVST